ncbi:Alpha/Beta hydrolase protein [Talaromyces proteolyticus]|uniref:Carboxylic ester hydrolase n=1 Tax=Talaromyces proteolyticus TaxID=1131652 RepID=A0AAD4L476_9EURO|nr:Alpha/Beta hydrolase protein [Talaromyces proteolyticus]KAH8703257.1 Alpha/Beta hydrolase protein [Talaromyces proteolyticus]
MKFTFLSVIALAANAALGEHVYRTENQLIVTTTTGKYGGLIDPKFPKTRQFRSIAFAEPPVLSRRWLRPQKLPPSTEHHDSYTFPPSCPQFVSKIPSLNNQYFSGGTLINNGNQNDTSGLVGVDTSEDCLYLAVWTPANATFHSKLPVLFFMSGGGFTTGGVDIPYQVPTGWVERSQSHLVVTINYRVNIFGFPNARGLTDQNLGTLDQRAALEWVRDNIAQFGGDPEKITLWGQSAGSISADAHAHAFYDDPIAHAYFLQSGTVFSGSAVTDTTYSNFSFVARKFGCQFANDSDGIAELECMRQVSFKQIENFVGQYADSGQQPALNFILVADESIIFSDYAARARAGKVAHRPAIISNVANEMSSLVPLPSNLTAGPDQALVLAYDLADWICPTYNSTVERNRLGIPVFRYQHAGTFPNLNPFKWLGAYHGSDVPMNFGTYGILTNLANATEFETEVSRNMQDHILAFAKDPYHGPQKIGWEPLVASNGSREGLIRFGADGKVIQYINGIEVDGACQGVGTYNPFP